MSALAKDGGAGQPFLVGKDLRPVWDLSLPDTPAPRTLGDFKLTDQMGREVRLEDLKNKIAIVSFFFSKCPGICPLTTKNLRAVQEEFKEEDRVVMLSFSITPETDTPETLQKYGRTNKIDPKKWHLLTGDRKKIYELARKSFDVDTFSFRENEIAKLTQADFLHSENVYLIDPKLRLRGIYAGRQPSSLSQLTHDAKSLLK